MFSSSGVDKYPFEQARATIDLANYYIFAAGKRKYAVPKKRASPSIAARFEAYAK